MNSEFKGVNSHILQVVLIHRYGPEVFTKIRFFLNRIYFWKKILWKLRRKIRSNFFENFRPWNLRFLRPFELELQFFSNMRHKDFVDRSQHFTGNWCLLQIWSTADLEATPSTRIEWLCRQLGWEVCWVWIAKFRVSEFYRKILPSVWRGREKW